jgi:predicted phosphodiesterase
VADITRIAIPDSHGSHACPDAMRAFLGDLKRLRPDEIVMLGDHLDAAGVFTSHGRSYTNEMAESYEEDCAATNAFLDEIQRLAPRAKIWYLEGNHEARVARWAASTFPSQRDAEAYLERMGPAAALELKRRGIRYVRRDEFMPGCSIPGTIRLARGGTAIYYTHGISAAKQATAVHLARFGANVVHGHTHRAQSCHGRTVEKGVIGAWCPGTLSKLQALYCHTNPTDWSNGYLLGVVSSSGKFVHLNVPLVKGESMLDQVGKVVTAGSKRR